MDALDRLAAKVSIDPESGCWLFTGYRTPNGYGRFSINGNAIYAHRAAYMLHVGPIPDGLVIDHLCRVRSCVNPQHLEATTQQENILRGESLSAVGLRTNRCKHGHEYTGANTHILPDGKRRCRRCNADRRREYVARARFGDDPGEGVDFGSVD